MPRRRAGRQEGDFGSGLGFRVLSLPYGLPEAATPVKRRSVSPEQRVLTETVMLQRATQDDPRALARFGGQVRDIVDPDGPPLPDDDPVRPERQLRRHLRRDGAMEFKGCLDAENAQLFEMLLKPYDKPHPDDDDNRGYAERAGDAFVDVLRMAANCLITSVKGDPQTA
jgi:hypothetical protein